MSYLDQSNLANDPDFQRRVSSALCTEGRANVADPLSKLILNSPPHGVTVFMPFVASAPGFADKYAAGGQGYIEDLEILSAVQASWADVATVQGL